MSELRVVCEFHIPPSISPIFQPVHFDDLHCISGSKITKVHIIYKSEEKVLTTTKIFKVIIILPVCLGDPRYLNFSSLRPAEKLKICNCGILLFF